MKVTGTGVRVLIRGLATLPHGHQEPLVVKEKAGRPRGKVGVSWYVECDTPPPSMSTIDFYSASPHPPLN